MYRSLFFDWKKIVTEKDDWYDDDDDWYEDKEEGDQFEEQCKKYVFFVTGPSSVGKSLSIQLLAQHYHFNVYYRERVLRRIVHLYHSFREQIYEIDSLFLTRSLLYENHWKERSMLTIFSVYGVVCQNTFINPLWRCGYSNREWWAYVWRHSFNHHENQSPSSFHLFKACGMIF